MLPGFVRLRLCICAVSRVQNCFLRRLLRKNQNLTRTAVILRFHLLHCVRAGRK